MCSHFRKNIIGKRYAIFMHVTSRNSTGKTWQQQSRTGSEVAKCIVDANCIIVKVRVKVKPITQSDIKKVEACTLFHVTFARTLTLHQQPVVGRFVVYNNSNNAETVIQVTLKKIFF